MNMIIYRAKYFLFGLIMCVMQTDYKNSISFNAKLGPNLKAYLLNNEFNGEPSHIKKFEKLFSDTFAKSIDTNTYIERKSNGKFELYNSAFPKIKVPINLSKRKDKTLAHKLINECSLAYGRAEYLLFERYIASQVAHGKTLEKIQSVGEKALNSIRKPYFLDLIDTAKRILKENPKSKLDELDFSDMINIQMREIIDTPEFQDMISKTFST